MGSLSSDYDSVEVDFTDSSEKFDGFEGAAAWVGGEGADVEWNYTAVIF